jgi:raffinose/stachyose/melibiose transport system permease protein
MTSFVARARAARTTRPVQRQAAGAKMWPAYAVLTVLGVFSIGPIVVLVFNSLKTDVEIGTNPLGPPLHHLSLRNFSQAWHQGAIGTTMLNSAVITLGTVVGVCFIAGLAAYALARLDLAGGTLVLGYLLFGTALPAQLFLVPLFSLWSRVGLYDTRLGLIIIYWAIFSPFATLLMRSFLISLPRDFEDAARIDGSRELYVLTRIVLPLAWPGLLTVALIAGLTAWNEFFFAVTFIQSSDKLPVVTSFLAFSQNYTRYWGLTCAAAIIIVLPVLFVFLALQRRFVEGLSSGGLKG